MSRNKLSESDVAGLSDVPDAGSVKRRLTGGKKAGEVVAAGAPQGLAGESRGGRSGRAGIARAGLQVDRRVGIALSVLPVKERRLVERAIQSRRVFDGLLAKAGDIPELATAGPLVYQLPVSPTLLLVFTLSGDTVCIEDVVETATLRHFADQKTTRPSRTRPRAAGQAEFPAESAGAAGCE